MIELLLSFLSDDLSSVFFPAFAFLSGIFLIVFMALQSKSKGKSLSAPYYICAFLLPVVTAIIYFFSCKKSSKEINAGKKKNVLSLVFCALFCFSYITTIIFGVYMVSDIASFNAYREEMQSGQQGDTLLTERIKLENENGQFVYYDAKGNEYTQSLMVKIYNEKGIPFDYARFQDFDEDGNTIYKGYYLDGSGRKLDAEYCFVNEDGVFVYNKDLEHEENDEAVFYYESPYTDGEGNNYYPATLASWNSDGELILK